MKNKKYIDADAVIAYLISLKEMPGVLYGEKKMLEEIISNVKYGAEKVTAAPAGLDWRSQDVWPRKEEADSKGGVLAVHKDDGHISRWKASSVIEYPWNFFCWAPMPKIPDDLMRPQKGKDGR